MRYKAFLKYSLLIFITISIVFFIINNVGKSSKQYELSKSKDVITEDDDVKNSIEGKPNNIISDTKPVNQKQEIIKTAQSPIEAKTAAENSSEYKNTILAYYFHGNYRCHTCRTIEALAYKTISEKFAVELQAGEIIWKELNVEQPENRHFIEEFQLYSSSLVIVKKDGEKTVSWKILQDVWRLARDENKFSEYVINEIKDMKDRKI